MGCVLAAIAMMGQTPVITDINPSAAVAGSSDLALGVVGANFVDGSVVLWNGAPLATLPGARTQLFATIRAALIVTPGSVRISVQNPGGLRSTEVPFTVLPAVTITTESLPPIVAGAVYRASLLASGGLPPYRWTANGQFPPGFSLSEAGAITGEPPSGSGPLTFNVRVTDATNATATRVFVVSAPVVEAPPLRITTTALAGARVGQPYTARIEATGGTPPYRWRLAQGSLAAAGLSLDGNGAVSGTPSTSGTLEFVVELRDSANRTVTSRFSLAIAPAPLTIATATSLPAGAAGAAYNQVFTASGGVSPYRWSVRSGDAAGLALDAVSGALEGLPRAAGTYNFEVQAADSRGETIAKAFTLVVGNNLTITTGAVLPAGAVGASYSQEFAAGGGAAPYTWAVAAGAVPGLSFDAAPLPVLSGAPALAGNFSISLRVRDSAGVTTTKVFSIAVTGAPLSLTGAGAIPDAKLNEAYRHTIVASGGAAPYSWTAAGLPDGLAIGAGTGIIAGSPSTSGDFFFTVRVSDSASGTAVDLYRLKVVAPPVPAMRFTGLPAVARAADQLPVGVVFDDPFPSRITGQLVLTFAPDSGGGDSTIRFSTGGRTAAFSLAAGSTEAATASPLAIQTGTVAGTITITASLTADGADITPARPPLVTLRIERAAPAIQRVRFIRTGNAVSAEVTGYSTSRDVTQASFSFSAGPGQSLQTSTVTASVEEVFSRWFQDPASTPFGSQFVFIQNFTVSGEVASVNLTSVTLTNRVGAATSTSVTP